MKTGKSSGTVWIWAGLAALVVVVALIAGLRHAYVTPHQPPQPQTVVDAKLIHQAQPVYPERARATGTQGDSWVRVTIGTTGSVADVSVAASSGSKMLDDAALQAARASTFKAALVDGVPTERSYLLHYTFRLDQK